MEKTISEEYVQQLSQLHDEKASFGDAKGLKAIKNGLKNLNQSIIDYGCGKGGVVPALKENYSSADTIGYDPGMVDQR